MPELTFQIEQMVPAVSQLLATLRITNLPESEAIHSISLRCQLQIAPAARRYNGEEKAALAELFGTPERWGRTLRALPWANVAITVREFSGSVSVELPVPCSFDLNVAAESYLDSLREGDIPLSFLFSGSVFYLNPEGTPQMAPIPWDREAHYRLPLETWKQIADAQPRSGLQEATAWIKRRREANAIQPVEDPLRRLKAFALEHEEL